MIERIHSLENNSSNETSFWLITASIQYCRLDIQNYCCESKRLRTKRYRRKLATILFISISGRIVKSWDLPVLSQLFCQIRPTVYRALGTFMARAVTSVKINRCSGVLPARFLWVTFMVIHCSWKSNHRPLLTAISLHRWTLACVGQRAARLQAYTCRSNGKVIYSAIRN